MSEELREVEKEIGRLLQSRDVALANRAREVLRQRRQLLYELRELDRKGKELRADGITWEYLDELTGGNDPDFD